MLSAFCTMTRAGRGEFARNFKSNFAAEAGTFVHYKLCQTFMAVTPLTL
jgi:hypothetical protein